MKSLNLEFGKAHEVYPIERCKWCWDADLPCGLCGERARELEKNGWIVLLENGWYIPVKKDENYETNKI